MWVEYRAQAQADRDHAETAGEDTTELDELIGELNQEIRRSGLRGNADPGRSRPRRQRSTRRRQDAPTCPSGRSAHTRSARPTPPRTARPSALRCSSPSPAPATAKSARMAPRPTRTATTTSGPPGTRYTSPPCSTGSFRTCAASSATTCSTSPPSSHKSDWPHTCTSPSAAPSLDGSCLCAYHIRSFQTGVRLWAHTR
jgi:hypothetical protein